MPHCSIYCERIEKFLLNVFFVERVVGDAYIQVNNQIRIKHAKVFGFPVSGYNVGHRGVGRKNLLSRPIGMLSIIVV